MFREPAGANPRARAFWFAKGVAPELLWELAFLAMLKNKIRVLKYAFTIIHV